MDRWKRFVDWCQQPSKIKIHKFNPNNELILVTSFIILASSIISSFMSTGHPSPVP